MERKAYVARVEDADDRRAIRVQSTESGKKLYQVIRADLIAEERTMIETLAPEVRQASLTLLRQLARAAEERCGVRANNLPEADTNE